jgi:hypothetical protein
VSPFLSFHHPARAFDRAILNSNSFFEGMHHDPAAFLQLVLCEVSGRQI